MLSGRSLASLGAGAGAGFAFGGPIGAVLGMGAMLGWSLWKSRSAGRFGPAMVKAALSMENESEDSPVVRALLAPYDPHATNWCGITIQGWIKAAASATGLHPSVTGSPQAKAIIQQFKDAKDAQWFDVATLRAQPSLMQPGMVAVWTRGDPAGWTGHIGLVIGAGTTTHGTKDPQAFVTMEGNNLPKIARFDHPLSSTSLLGMGRFNV